MRRQRGVHVIGDICSNTVNGLLAIQDVRRQFDGSLPAPPGKRVNLNSVSPGGEERCEFGDETFPSAAIGQAVKMNQTDPHTTATEVRQLRRAAPDRQGWKKRTNSSIRAPQKPTGTGPQKVALRRATP